MAGNLGVTFLIGAHLQASVGSAFASVTDKLRATRQAFRNASRQSRQLADALAVTERRQGAVARAREQMRASGHVDDSLRRELAKLNQEYARATRAAGVYGQSVAEIERRQRAMAQSVEASQRRLARLQSVESGRGLKQSGVSQRAGAYGAAATTFATVRQALQPLEIGMGFEEAMSKVGAISQASAADLAKLEAQARQLGATTVWSAKEAAEGMTFLSMAGFKTEQTLAAMPGMLSLASAGNVDLGRTADIASNILTGFGMDAAQMTHVADVMAKTFTSSNTSIESLGESFKYCAPSAKAAGQSFEDVSAMIAKLGDAGIQGSMAGTALNAIMLRMASPPKMAMEAFTALGVEVADSNGKIKAMPDLLAELGFRMSKLTDVEKVDLARKIFGMENAKSGIALMEQAMKGEIQKMSRDLVNSDGLAARVANQQIDNLSGDLKGLNSAAEEVAICLYQSVSPALRSMTQGITEIIRPMGEWIKANPEVVRGVAMIGAALVGLKVASVGFSWLGGVRKSFVGNLVAMRGHAALACGGIRGAFGQMRAQLLQPVSMSFGGAQASLQSFRARLASLRATAGRAVSSLRQIGPASIMAGAQAAASGAMAATGRVGFNALRLGVKGVGIAFKTAFGPISLLMMGLSMGVEYVMEHWDQIQPYFQALWDGVKSVFNMVMSWLQPIIDKIVGFIGPVVDKIKGFFSAIGKAWDWVTGGDEKKLDEKMAEKAAVQPAASEAAVKTPAQMREEQEWADAGLKGKRRMDEADAQEKAAKEAKKAKKAARNKKKDPFAEQRAMMDELGDDYGDRLDDRDPGDYLPVKPKKRGNGGAASPQAKASAAPQVTQPQVQVAINVTQNGIPDAQFAQGVMNAIRARQSEFEGIISALVNEQARLAYGG